MSDGAGAPVTMEVLAALAEAGDKGLLAGEISRRFSRPENITARQARSNWVLRQQQSEGHVRRGGTEPTPFYHNTPCYRWHITDEGRDYLASGGWEGKAARNRARLGALAAEKAARRKRHAEMTRLVTEAASAVPPGCRARRDEVIIWARAEGLPLEWISALFGITRERARQIARRTAKRPQACPCGCQAYSLLGAAAVPALHDGLGLHVPLARVVPAGAVAVAVQPGLVRPVPPQHPDGTPDGGAADEAPADDVGDHLFFFRPLLSVSWLCGLGFPPRRCRSSRAMRA